jgi:GntR family transcriptional regulator, carbon starvation induced regulator
MVVRFEQPVPVTADTPSRTLATDLFEQLRSDILHNRLDPGSRLRFKDLRERYHSGLSPLREALMRLVSEGLVVLEDHKGFRVAPVSREEMQDIANTLLELEALAIRMAVKKGDDRWEAEIVARFHELSKRQMFAADGTLDTEWEARNVAFHESLYAACGSPSLKLVCHVLYERHSRYRRLRTKNTGKPDRDVSKEHETLMRATVARDATAAIAQLRKHRSATLGDVLADWPIKEVQTEAATGASKPGSRRQPRRRLEVLARKTAAK